MQNLQNEIPQIPYRITEKGNPAIKQFVKGSDDAIGYDLCLPYPIIINSGNYVSVNFGVSIDLSALYSLPPYLTLGAELHIRSGLSKKGLSLVNSVGIIDTDYQGELIANIAYNPFECGDRVISLAEGVRVCQLVLGVYPKVAGFTKVDSFIKTTERGTKGFGSTGNGGDVVVSDFDADKTTKMQIPLTLLPVDEK